MKIIDQQARNDNYQMDNQHKLLFQIIKYFPSLNCFNLRATVWTWLGVLVAEAEPWQLSFDVTYHTSRK